MLAAWKARYSQYNSTHINDVDDPGLGTVDIRSWLPFGPVVVANVVGSRNPGNRAVIGNSRVVKLVNR